MPRLGLSNGTFISSCIPTAGLDPGGPDLHVRVQRVRAGDDADHPEGHNQRADGRWAYLLAQMAFPCSVNYDPFPSQTGHVSLPIADASHYT